MTEGREIGPQEVQALESLLVLAVRLKESGLLDLLTILAERYEEVVALISNDTAMMRGIALADAAMNSIRSLDPHDMPRLKKTIEEIMGCALKAIARIDPAKMKPRSTLGILAGLRDEDVRAGLTLLLEIAGSIGRCVQRSGHQTPRPPASQKGV